MSFVDAKVIEVSTVQTAPLQYDLSATEAIAPQSMSVTFDGTAAAGNFLACVDFLAPDGTLIARCPADASVTAGDVAEVTFAPFLRTASSGTGGSGIQFDVDNVGGWLDVKTTTFEPIDGNGMHFRATGDGNPIEMDAEGGFSFNDTHGWGITFVSTTGLGGSADFNVITGRDQTYNAGRTISMQAASFFNAAASDTMTLGATNKVEISSSGTAGVNVQVNNAAGQLFIQGSAGALIVLDPTILPVAAPGTSHALWNNAGVLNITP